MRSPARPVLLLALAFCSFSTRASAQTASNDACASLAEQKLPNTTITAAQAVTTGTFTPPARPTRSRTCRRSAASRA